MSFRARPYLSFGIAFDQPAERRAGHDALVAVEGVFVFLVRDERINLAAAHQHDVPDLGAAQIFLQKNTLGIIDVPQPCPRVLDRLAQNRVDRAGRRAKRIFDDKRLRMFRQDFFGRFLVGGNVGLRKGNFEIRAQLPGEVALALNPHRLARGAENADARLQQILRPRLQRPVNGLRDDDLHAVFLDERNRAGKRVARKSRPDQRRREMAVIAGEISRDLRARVRQRPPDAVRERADAENHDRCRRALPNWNFGCHVKFACAPMFHKPCPVAQCQARGSICILTGRGY